MRFRQLTGLTRVHFVGIGGAGMSGIAELLLDYELEVSGSDLCASEATQRLESLGARVFVGHRPEQVQGADLVVVSSAVPARNVEVVAARERGIPVVRRAEMLAELMRLKYGVAVAGTHGKTTTTSLIGAALTEAGLDPTVIIGGRLRVSGTGARHGSSDYMVVEADEFDRSFLALAPVVAVVTTVDLDHLDTYRDYDDLLEAFAEFASKVPFFGCVVLCLDDPGVMDLLPKLLDRRLVTYGFDPQAEVCGRVVERHGQRVRFDVSHRERGSLGSIELQIPGDHNVRNALAAVAVGLSLGIDFNVLACALSQFTGVHRRFERLGYFHGAAVVDDYAHHPTEVAATLVAARDVFPGKLSAVFQPHLYSRTRDHAGGFGRALLLADQVLVTDIYASREAAEPGVTAQLVVDAARALGHLQIEHCPSWDEIPGKLRGVGTGDAILTLGAGDIYRLGERLAAGDDVRELAP
jgi:UDP-N-acetylmuramate--alanine ligase